MNRSIPSWLKDKYEIHEWRNAISVLKMAHPTEWADILSVLKNFRLKKRYIVAPGGQKSQISQKIDSEFYERGWIEKSFDTEIKVDEQIYKSPTHSVDCYKNKVALEIEWNNKDPFFDRDLNNFRLLFDLRAIEVGVIITRSDELQDIFNRLHRGSSFGQSTTHMGKLLPRIEGGGGAGCPVLVFGISKELYES